MQHARFAMAAIAFGSLAAPAASGNIGFDVVLEADESAVRLTGNVYDDDTDLTVPARHLADGRAAFLSDFVTIDTLKGDQVTDNPGWRILGGAPDGDIIGLEPLAGLLFWDGAQWVSSVPAGERIRLTGKVGVTTITLTDVGAAGVDGDAVVLLEPITGGGIHSHQDFSLVDATGTVFPGAAIGAYAFEAQLVGFTSLIPYTPKQTPSESFFLVFNYGLAPAAFEEAVDALGAPPATPVPVPLPALLAGAIGVVATGLALGRGRRRVH